MTVPEERLGIQQRHRRGKLLRWCFCIGAIIPVALVLIGSGMSSRSDIGGHTTTLQWIFLWVIWPTWIFLFDTEHFATVVLMTAISAVLNGLWYMGIAFIVSRAVSRMRDAGKSGTA